MRATERPLVAVNATGCLEVFSTPYPETSWRVAVAALAFGNAPAVATGVAAALKVKGRTDVRVVAQAGDGGTVDIGFGCLSGMFERNDDVLFICYDNEAYMNTGVQRSGATPPAARTATTEAVGPEPGNVFGQGKTCRGSRWPTASPTSPPPRWPTSTISRPRSSGRWSSTAPATCTSSSLPPRLGRRPSDTIRVARLATETGLFPVFEAEHGEVIAYRRSATVPVEAYLRSSVATPTSSGDDGRPTSSPASKPSPTATSRASASWRTGSNRGTPDEETAP